MEARPLHEVDFKKRPFFLADARRVGMRWHDLQTTEWRRVGYGQYASIRLRQDVRLTLEAVVQRLPAGSAFSGHTAAWILGLDLPPCDPIEVTVRRDVPVRARIGIKLRRAALPESDVSVVRGFPTTSKLRTVRDLGSGRDLIESVVAVDMSLRARLVERSDLTDYVFAHPGDKGIKRLRRATALCDARSESPMETRLRIQLVAAQLPTPQVQAELRDSDGSPIGRADLYYADRRLVIEYDGDNHRQRLADDVRRQNRILNAGYHMLRFAAVDMRDPSVVVEQVRNTLSRLPDLNAKPKSHRA